MGTPIEPEEFSSDIVDNPNNVSCVALTVFTAENDTEYDTAHAENQGNNINADNLGNSVVSSGTTHPKGFQMVRDSDSKKKKKNKDSVSVDGDDVGCFGGWYLFCYHIDLDCGDCGCVDCLGDD